MHVKVLGSVRAARDGEPGTDGWFDVGARKPRSIVAALALHAGRPVSADLLADLVWAGDPPRAAHGALHAYISGLRKALEPGRVARAAASVLETTDHGYLLRVDRDHVDAHRFARDVGRAERVLAPLVSQLTTGDPAGWPDRDAVAAALDDLDAALATWTGEPYADLAEHPDVVAERASLEQSRTAAEQARLLGLLALGEHAGVLSATESRIAANPLQERWWSLHALALTRAGRQAEALEALRRVRDLLADELGLDPGAELRELERAVLRQEPGLMRTLAATPARARPGSSDPPPIAAAPVDPAAAEAGGRTTERARLHGLLDQPATAALVVGEPGIGKSWLVSDLAAEARRRGVLVARGACSQDDGAPPLWPWLSVLRTLAPAGDSALIDLPSLVAAGGDGESPARQAFETSDRIATSLLGAAAERPVLLVLDDLHWADDATLRTLRHVLAVTPPDARLAVVGTRRTHPEPTGALAEVGEALARRHALRLELGGLDLAAAGTLVRRVAGADVPDATVAAWHARAEGNPFFLVELARLGETADRQVPTTVRDVVTRRVAALTPRAQDTLRLAAVAGRRFLTPTVAAAGGWDPDDVADDLEEAGVAGLVHERDVGDYVFAHALARDAVRESVPPTRRARLHAQVAHALEADGGARALVAPDELTAELARHWLAAGPSHLDRAWRAADAAAAQARSLSAYREAMNLRTAAVDAHRTAPGTAEEDRFGLLLELATDAAYAARWPGVEEAAVEAIALGRRLGSPERVGLAAAALTLYCVWLPHDVDVVPEDVVDDLRWALGRVAVDDAATRCRLQLALAVELYYAPDARAERRALVETGMALARRVGDPRLHWWAARAAWMACWTPADALDRAEWATEGLAAARTARDPAAEAVLLVTLAITELELARRGPWEEHAAAAERLALEERLPYVLLTLQWIQLSMATLRGDRALAERRYDELVVTAPQVAVPMQEMQAVAAATLARLWDPPLLREVVDEMVRAHEEHHQVAATLHLMLARCGYAAELRQSLDDYPIPHEEDESWSLVADWAGEAEAASLVGDRGIAQHALTVLEPYAGRMVVTGAVLAYGPVDGYLALAHAVLGDLDAAAEHAQAASDLAATWGLASYDVWLRTQRERLGF